MKEKLTKTFDQLANSYEQEDPKSNAYNLFYERPAMTELLPDALDGLTVLDAGCAGGWYTEYLIRMGAEVTAIDISPDMAEATRRRTQGKAKVHCCDLSEPLPFSDDTFDLILSSLTLHYLKNWEEPFSEFVRILKPGGVFLYSVHHPMMDLSLSQTKAYFLTELLTDQWNKGGQTIDVQFYRRPLQDIFNVTSKYFSVEGIREPVPVEDMKKVSLDAYERLMKKPAFLIVKAAKR